MKISSNALSANLKQQLLPIYLVTGDEFLLVEEACEQIYLTANNAGITERQRWQANRTFNWQQLTDAANSIALFDDNYLLEISMSSLKLTDAAKEAMISYCNNLPKNKVLILKTDKIDTRTLNSAWCKIIEKTGAIVQCWPIATEQLPAWIRSRLQQEGLTATPEAIRVIAEQVEGNLLAAKQEIEKLKLLYDKKYLQLEDVVSAMSDNSRYDVFKLADCALSGDTKRTLRIMRSLKAENAEPTLILWTLTREIRALISIKALLEQNENLSHVFQKFGVWEKRKPIMNAALKRLEKPTLTALIKQASQIDRMIKGVASGNAWDHLTQMSLQLAGQPNIFHK